MSDKTTECCDSTTQCCDTTTVGSDTTTECCDATTDRGDTAAECCDTTTCCTPVTRSVPLRNVRPAVDIVEHDDAWLLIADLPGVSGDAVDLQIQRGELRLSADQQVDPDSNDEGYVLRERAPRRFVRTFRIGDGIETAGIKADFQAGVLTVTLPKATELKPRRIQVG